MTKYRVQFSSPFGEGPHYDVEATSRDYAVYKAVVDNAIEMGEMDIKFGAEPLTALKGMQFGLALGVLTMDVTEL